MNCVDAASIAPSAWGPAMWRFLHTFAYHLDEPTTMIGFGTMLTALVRAIPCDVCRAHALSYVEKRRPPSSARDAVRYVCAFHNAVNRRLHTPEYVPRRCALAHERSSLTFRATAVVRRLQRALPKRCAPAHLRSSTTIELAIYGDAARRTHDLKSAIALIKSATRP